MYIKSILYTSYKHKDAHVTEAEATDFSICLLYVNNSFNQHLPSSIKLKVGKLKGEPESKIRIFL